MNAMIKAAFYNAATHLVDYNLFILGISVGARNHRGPYLKAIVKLLNDRAQQNGIINVADTLRRYTFMAQGIPEEDAIKKAQAMGNQWVSENSHILTDLDAQWRMLRWDKFLKDPRFYDYLKRFDRALAVSDVLQNAINDDTMNFYKRIKGKTYKPSPLELRCSTTFFIEELAVLSIQFEDHPAAQIYAGKELQCLKVVRAGLVPDVPTGIQNAKIFSN